MQVSASEEQFGRIKLATDNVLKIKNNKKLSLKLQNLNPVKLDLSELR